MTLFGLDPTAQWLLLGGSILVLLAGIIVGLLLSGADARYRATRHENHRLATELGRAKARIRELQVGADVAELKKDLSHANARADRLLEDKVQLLGRVDRLHQQVTELTAERDEVAGERDEKARQVDTLTEDIRVLRGVRMDLSGRIEDQAAQMERQAADIQRLRHTSSAAEIARLTDALKLMEERAERDRLKLEELETGQAVHR